MALVPLVVDSLVLYPFSVDSSVIYILGMVSMDVELLVIYPLPKDPSLLFLILSLILSFALTSPPLGDCLSFSDKDDDSCPLLN